MNGGVLSGLFKKILAGAGDDVAAKVSSQYGDDVIRNLASSSADDIAAKQGNLIATHQLTADKLKGVADMGGFVQPSMAVVDPSKGTNFLPGSDFGDIVMVSNRNAIDPARKAAKAVIGDRDIYSPRFPDTRYQLNESALDDMVRSTPGLSKQSALSNMDLDDDAIRDYFLQDAYRKSNPAVGKAHGDELAEMPEFVNFANDAQAKLRGEQMLEYLTPSGNTKTLPVSAENANKIMNKTGAVGSEGGIQTPTRKIYHQNTRTLNSLDDLYKNRYRLIDNQTGEATQDAMTNSMHELANKIDQRGIAPFNEGSDWRRFDDISEYLADAASGQRNLYPALDELPDDIVNEIGRLQKAYQEVPVSYFEAKPRRVVGGNEFYGAYVPENAPQSVIDDLQRLGVTNVNRYIDAGDLDLSLAKLAREGKRGVSPYVLGLGGLLPTAGVLGSMFSGNGNDQQPMA